MAMTGMALVLSYTRTGWVMVVLGALVLGIARYRVLLVVVPLAIAIAFVALPGVHSRVQSVNQQQELQYGTGDSFHTRVELWRQNLPKAQQKPLTGLGLGSIVQESDTSAHVHSDYVRALVETGVFGFLAFVWLLLSAAVGCAVAMRWARRSGSVPLQAAAVAGFAAAVAYILASGDSNLMTQSSVSGAAWALLGCAHAAGTIGRDRVAPRPLPAAETRRRAAAGRARRGRLPAGHLGGDGVGGREGLLEGLVELVLALIKGLIGLGLRVGRLGAVVPRHPPG